MPSMNDDEMKRIFDQYQEQFAPSSEGQKTVRLTPTEPPKPLVYGYRQGVVGGASDPFRASRAGYIPPASDAPWNVQVREFEASVKSRLDAMRKDIDDLMPDTAEERSIPALRTSVSILHKRIDVWEANLEEFVASLNKHHDRIGNVERDISKARNDIGYLNNHRIKLEERAESLERYATSQWHQLEQQRTLLDDLNRRVGAMQQAKNVRDATQSDAAAEKLREFVEQRRMEQEAEARHWERIRFQEEQKRKAQEQEKLNANPFWSEYPNRPKKLEEVQTLTSTLESTTEEPSLVAFLLAGILLCFLCVLIFPAIAPFFILAGSGLALVLLVAN